MCVCPRIDPLRFLVRCRRRQLNQDLVVALDFCVSVSSEACSCVIFWFLGACFVYFVTFSLSVPVQLIAIVQFLPDDLLCVEWGLLNLSS